ncbi:MAG TPA: adenylate/guanylate cyclase domain-containing protein [Ignavibacteria bacterium]|nr:adenylate/guanylate cyclase domain-containing protein [Ignavibacteria bacterium]HAX48762.1 adenylate/guanylate cyclase domain-containing protein [Bacteroidota bacterium]HRE10583.1 adenylate/guanylate cyclase domain-containing protein [Ignavibacteria bacterium]HRF64870.1 adenylate/guanylate cyclase domain-containing protein [Ignavibacteria bacterium]HRJ04750.1 adenylate/guanylate cyclase domain-containing protein [Ignavibacteria bacterium]
MKKRIKEIRFNLIAWLIAGNMFVVFRFFGMYDFEQYFILKKPIEMELMFLEGNIVAVVNGLLLSLVDFFLDTPKFKRRSFRYILTFKSAAYIVTMFFSIVSIFVLHGIIINRENNLMYSLLYTLNSQYTIALYLYGAFISLLINFLKEVNKKFGPGILVKLFSGRYYNPRIEDRIFMFIDLQASTTIAEKLGHIKYSRLIQDCFYDITEVVARYKAEIYQYVGDEIVLSWELEKGIENDNCFQFFFEFRKKLDQVSGYYRDKYGIVPIFKAGMNCGTVTVAEVGELKKEIAYHGDVLNTASRIQDQCNAHNKPFLISSNLYKRIPRSGKFKIDLIGEVLLKGKLQPVAIYSVESTR